MSQCWDMPNETNCWLVLVFCGGIYIFLSFRVVKCEWYVGFVVFEGKELKNKQTIRVPLALPAHIGTPEGGDEEAYLRTKTDLARSTHKFPLWSDFSIVPPLFLALDEIIRNQIWRNWLRGLVLVTHHTHRGLRFQLIPFPNTCCFRYILTNIPLLSRNFLSLSIAFFINQFVTICTMHHSLLKLVFVALRIWAKFH